MPINYVEVDAKLVAAEKEEKANQETLKRLTSMIVSAESLVQTLPKKSKILRKENTCCKS